MEQTDKLVIIGAGPAGSAAALEASRRGIPCILIDRASFPRNKVCGDALSGKVVDELRRLGIDPRLFFTESHQARPSWGICFSAPSGEQLRIPFRVSSNHDFDTPPGYTMRRYDFDYALVSLATNCRQVDFQPGQRLKDIERDQRRIVLRFEKGRIIRADAVIAADGVNSIARRLVNRQPWPNRRLCAGVRAYYRGVRGLDPEGFIELHFLPELLPGYLWIFPMKDDLANVGLGMRSDVVVRKKVVLRELLTKLIFTHPLFRSRFRQAHIQGQIEGSGLALGGCWANLAGNGILCCGDAGSLIDPFTGEGIGNALLSGRMAAQQFDLAYGKNHFDQFALDLYPQLLREKLAKEFEISHWLQRLSCLPWLFNRVIRQANRHTELQQALACMFEDMNSRKNLLHPHFYFKWVLG